MPLSKPNFTRNVINAGRSVPWKHPFSSISPWLFGTPGVAYGDDGGTGIITLTSLSALTRPLDNATRANENPLTNGGKWGGDVLGRTQHELQIVSNKIVVVNAALGNSGSAIWLPMPSSADQSSFMTINGIGSVGSQEYYETFNRLQNFGAGVADGYAIVAQIGVTVRIDRLDAGVSNEILNTGVAWSEGDSFEFRSVGNTHSAYQNGTLIGSVVDSTYPGNGKLALLLGPGVVNGDSAVTQFDGSPFADIEQSVDSNTGIVTLTPITVVPAGLPSSFPLLDDFNRPNEDPIDPVRYTSTELGVDETLKLISNQAAIRSVTNGASGIWKDTFSADQGAFVKLPVIPHNYAEVLCRVTTPGGSVTSCYGIYAGTSQGNFVKLELIVASNGADISGGTFAIPSISDVDGLGIVAIGNTLTAWYHTISGGSWVKAGSITDGTLTGSGQIGFRLRDTTDTTSRADDLYGGSVTSTYPAEIAQYIDSNTGVLALTASGSSLP